MFSKPFKTLSSCKLDPQLGGLLNCKCPDQVYSQYKDLKVTVDGTTVYTITKFDYSSRTLANECIFKVMSLQFPAAPIEKRFWVMGLTFFHNYYAIFDADEMRVGLAESILTQNTLQSIQILAAIPAVGSNEISVTWTLIQLLIFVIASVVLTIYQFKGSQPSNSDDLRTPLLSNH